MKIISGGVTAAQGFRAAGIRCGVKTGKGDGNQPIVPSMKEYLTGKKDLAMILSDVECAAAGVYTLNRVKAAPVYISMEHLEDGVCRGIIANSGNANACAPQSHENAEKMCELAAAATGLKPTDFAVASTGVIGQTLNIAAIEQGIPFLVQNLSADGSDDAGAAIMTTDTVPKNIAIQFTLDGQTVRMGGIAKGSGMIHPNMGTMLCFITTDASISPDMLKAALDEVIPRTFNRVTVDGDTSTNDTCILLANGLAGNNLIEWKDDNYTLFVTALRQVCETLAKAIAADGEGATRLLTCTVDGARSEEVAERLGRAVVGSSLVKAAMFGADANWGRVIAAMGYSRAPFRPEHVDISFASVLGEIPVCVKGEPLDFDEERATAILKQDEVTIRIHVNEGSCSATCWGCDLTYDYVKINGDYRS